MSSSQLRLALQQPVIVADRPGDQGARGDMYLCNLNFKPTPGGMHLPKILFHQSEGRQALRPQADQAHAFGMYPEEVVPNLQSGRLL